MTLALYGKSGKRKAVLVLAAFLAVIVAVVGGASSLKGALATPNMTVTGTPTCVTDTAGNEISWKIDWTASNPESRAMTITVNSITAPLSNPTFSPNPAAANGSSTASTTGISTTISSVTLDITGSWTNPTASDNDTKDINRPSGCGGKIQFHKYIPKDNVNVPWKNIANPKFTFDIHTGSAAGPIIASGDQLGSPLSNIPETDVYVTEQSVSGYPIYGFFVPDEGPDSGNDKCNTRTTSSTPPLVTGSSLHVTPSMWQTKGDQQGVLHICAYNNPDPGHITIKKVGNASDATTVFSGLIDAGADDSQTWQITGIGGSTTKDVSAGDHEISETTPGNGWTLYGFATIPSGDCPLDKNSYETGSHAGEFSVDPGESLTICVLNLQPSRTLRIIKMASGGDELTFGGTISNFGNWAITVQGNSEAEDYLVDRSHTHQVAETNLPAGWELDGYTIQSGLKNDYNCDDVSYTTQEPIVPADSNSYTVCVKNHKVPMRTIRIIKIADGGNDTFVGTISNYVGGFSLTTVSGHDSEDYEATLGQSHQVTETPVPAGWELDGYKVLTGLKSYTDCGSTDYSKDPPTINPPAAGPLHGGGGDPNDVTVCIKNHKIPMRQITITKVAIGGDDTFAGTISNYVGGFSLATSGGTATHDYDVTSSETHQVVETPVPANWILDGYKLVAGLHATCPSEGYELPGTNGGAPLAPAPAPLSSPPNLVPDDGLPYTVCIKNHALGSIKIVKIDTTLPGDLTKDLPWNFTVTGGPGYTTSLPGNGDVVIPNVPAGTYAVSEGSDFHSSTNCPALPNTAQQGYFSSVSNTDNTINAPGEQITWTFTNQPCPTEQAAPNLSVSKVIDFNGDGVMNGTDYFADGWAITVTCGQSVLNGTTGANGSGNVLFLGTPTGNCTVAETTQAGYNAAVKFTRTDGGVTTSGPGWQLPITQQNDENNLVVFFNQPLVNIHVHKDTVTNAGKQNGAGWKFTLSGCGITPQERTTDSAGDADFTGLPAAVGCTYTVTETEQVGWTVSPAGFQTASPTAPGSTANLTFTNTNIITCGIECLRRPETPTVPPPPPPSPSPEVTRVAGERTAGPAIESTPIAPSTGTGTTGGGTPVTIVLALAGVAMAGSAFAITIFARKPHR